MHLVENIHGIGSKGYLRDLGNGCGMYETGEIVRIIPEEYGNKVTPDMLVNLMDENDVEKADRRKVLKERQKNILKIKLQNKINARRVENAYQFKK